MKIILLLSLAFTALALVEPSIVCKDLQLPWGAYSGTLSKGGTICQYFDVRFGSAPVGSLRFAAPEYPPATVNGTAPKAPGAHMSCVQMNPTQCLLGGPIGAGKPNCFPSRYGIEDEDCLFLDIYVPQSIESSSPLPVVVWIYGGAYTSGSKNQFDPSIIPFYAGNGPVDAASKFNKKKTSTIFVTGNYRLGAYGWLAGTYMEKHAQPNAGLLDQSTVLQFVQDHIAKVNGDPNRVSVWGESAGASSIMHHLVMKKNLQNPPFRTAILQSPAYQWMWNRTGDLNDTFSDFASRVAKGAKCQVADMDCLRSAPAKVVMSVNQEYAGVIACVGIMPFGPAVDGNLIPALAPALFRAGKVAPLDSILVSHVDLEVPYANANAAFSFIPQPIRTNPQNETIFEQFLRNVFRGSAYDSLVQSILTKYPRDQFSDQIARAASVITDVSFDCNTRFIINQYLSRKTPVYALDYAIGRTFQNKVYNASFHGSDLLPLFSTPRTIYAKTLKCIRPDLGVLAIAVDRGIRFVVAPPMQRYFTNLAISGNINSGNPTRQVWKQAYISGCMGPSDDNKCVWNLMVPQIEDLKGDYWKNNTGPDLGTSDRTCRFWDDAAAQISGFNNKASGDVEQEALSWEL